MSVEFKQALERFISKVNSEGFEYATMEYSDELLNAAPDELSDAISDFIECSDILFEMVNRYAENEGIEGIAE